MRTLFTSESVSEGHPDKVADQISDAILDEFLKQDPESKVACEVFVTTGLVVIGGEVRSNAWVDIQQIARRSLPILVIQKPSISSKPNPAELYPPSMNNLPTS